MPREGRSLTSELDRVRLESHPFAVFLQMTGRLALESVDVYDAEFLARGSFGVRTC
jgi:hypothetical protein